MKRHLHELFSSALEHLRANGALPRDAAYEIRFARSRQPHHGDFATNLALTLAKIARRSPREMAQLIVDALPESQWLARVEVAGPGFINVFLVPGAQFEVLRRIREQGDRYGHAEPGRRILIEFVSANPTGPLHVGHGRGAAYGDALARILSAVGHHVESEYYVNDAGRQTDILALSVWLRYLELCGETTSYPENAYQGDYIFDIAATVHREHAILFCRSADEIYSTLDAADPESRLDALIQRAKDLLGPHYQTVLKTGVETILEDIRGELKQLNVEYDSWFSERALVTQAEVERVIADLKRTNYMYQRDNAWWFRSTAFGDEKDRVVVRAGGEPTYFASDIAYHLNKLDRGFDQLIDIWGADHHGYIARVRGALQGLGENPDRLTVLLVQFAVLYRGSEKVSMSTRSGDFVTLRELRQEIGVDAARFFYVLRKSDQHMDFDLDLAAAQTNENPVYYVQYAHARICSVFRQASDLGLDVGRLDSADLAQLTEPQEHKLGATLSRYSDVLHSAARDYEPHQLAYYLRDLATEFHTYYNAHRFLDVEPELRLARLLLVDATRQIICNGLNLLGVGAPESM